MLDKTFLQTRKYLHKVHVSRLLEEQWWIEPSYNWCNFWEESLPSILQIGSEKDTAWMLFHNFVVWKNKE